MKRILLFTISVFYLAHPHLAQDNLSLKEFEHATDYPPNDYLISELAPVRRSFSRITSKSDWNSIQTISLDKSTEGGEARIYRGEQGRERITVHLFGEMYQSLNEYFLEDGELIMVVERTLKYNRPIYFDEETAAEFGDEPFDTFKSQLVEARNYFIGGAMVHQVHNQDCGAPFDQSYIDSENDRIWSEFTALVTEIDNNTDHSDRSIIGVWQGIPVLGSGWSTNYQFFGDATFHYNHNQMDCADSILFESGRYDLMDDTLILNFESINYLAGGTLEKATGSCGSEFQLVGGEETTADVVRTEKLSLKFVSPLFDYEYLERVLIDDTEWFRMLHNPNDY